MSKNVKIFIKTGKTSTFGIIQGGMYKDLREKSVKGITDIGFLAML